MIQAPSPSHGTDRSVSLSRPTRAEIDERIRNLEVRCDLLRYKIDGWCAWSVLRPWLFHVLLKVLRRASQSRQWYGRPIMAICDLVRLAGLRETHYLVKTYTSALLEPEGNMFKDIWMDDLLRQIGSFQKIESVNNPLFLNRRKNALIRSHATSTLFESIAAMLAAYGGSRPVLAIAKALTTVLQQEFGEGGITEQLVARRLLRFLWQKRLYGLMLRKVRPRCVIVADPGEYALVAAAKEQSIKVVELQHGYIDRYHSAYSWTRYALAQKAEMPIPDLLFLYGEFWKDELDVHGFWGDALRVVGNLRMDEYRQRGVERWNEQEYNLVVTSQGIDVDRVVDFLERFLIESAEKVPVRLSIKLHPVYDGDMTPYVAAFRQDPRVTIIAANENPTTYQLLACADLHVSISSTCHCEALGLGVPTAILPFTLHEQVLFLHEKGLAFLVKNPKMLVEVLENARTQRISADVGEYFFKSGALINMKRELTCC